MRTPFPQLRQLPQLHRGAAAGALLASLMSLAAPARADAIVSVQLRDAAGKPADGTVTLVDPGGNKVASCETRAGACEMSGVPGGSYRAEVAPKDGDAPKPRKVMIPPQGKVSLIVSTGG